MSFEFEAEHIIAIKQDNPEKKTSPSNLLNKLLDLVYNLDYYTQTVHLDMGGKHKYSIWGKGHDVITEIKVFLYELDKENDVIPN